MFTVLILKLLFHESLSPLNVTLMSSFFQTVDFDPLVG